MASELRERRSDSRVVLRIGVYFEPEPTGRSGERGRQALAGPAPWLAERLNEYVEAGADGFVVNLDHEEPGLADRLERFAEEVAPLIRRCDPGERTTGVGDELAHPLGTNSRSGW